MTAFQTRQLTEIRAERKDRSAKFAATKATAEIGVVSNIPGTFTVNTLNGPRKANFENQPFATMTDAVKAYAADKFGAGTLKRTGAGTFLVFPA